MPSKSPLLPIALAATSVAFALSPVFTKGFAGFRPAQFPVVQDVWPVQPAGWAFSIWGVIYLWLIIGTAWGAFKASQDKDWEPGRPPLLISLAIGTVWIAAANASPLLATAMILVMTGFAIRAMLLSGRKSPALQTRPIALYAGWLTAASGVAAGVTLGGYGLLSAQAAALTMLVLVLAVALFVQSRRPAEWAYPLALIWALSGVIAANLASANFPVIALCGLGILLLGLGLLRGHKPQTGAS